VLRLSASSRYKGKLKINKYIQSEQLLGGNGNFFIVNYDRERFGWGEVGFHGLVISV
jgi:hypothetical protein